VGAGAAAEAAARLVIMADPARTVTSTPRDRNSPEHD